MKGFIEYIIECINEVERELEQDLKRTKIIKRRELSVDTNKRIALGVINEDDR